MLYSRTCEYAIRALTYMARKPQGDFSQIKEIASSEGLPQHFLSKVLQSLVRFNIVISARGPTGGFARAREKDKISLDNTFILQISLSGKQKNVNFYKGNLSNTIDLCYLDAGKFSALIDNLYSHIQKFI